MERERLTYSDLEQLMNYMNFYPRKTAPIVFQIIRKGVKKRYKKCPKI